MEILFAGVVGGMTAAGIYLVLQARSFPIVVGLSLLSYAVNLFLLGTGRLIQDAPPVIEAGVRTYADPLPQALVLTAIVISFAMTALLVVLALRSFLERGHDRTRMETFEPTDLGKTP